MRYGLGAAYLRQMANASARVRAWSFRIARLAWVYIVLRDTVSSSAICAVDFPWKNS